MRVLCLTPELPYAPGGSGGSTRQFHLLERLVEKGHAVEVVAPVHVSQREGMRRLTDAGVSLRAVLRPPSRVKETAGAVARRPGLLPRALGEPLLAWQTDVFWTALRTRLPHQRPDVILVEHDWAAGWWPDLPQGIPRALTLHNLSWAYYEARARATQGPAAVALKAEARRFRRHDARHLDRYDLLIAMSAEDREAVKALSSRRCEVVENGVDTGAFTPAPPAGGPPLFLYTGTMSYAPNAEGLLWLLREVWPEIRRRVPDARLRVVGRGAPEEAQRLAGPDVELTGWVESMAPHFAAATAVLVPILSGGGTRLKVLDAMASGRAMVATAPGRAGIEAEDGVHLLQADGTEAFAAAAVRLAGDAALRERLAAAARKRAVQMYDWASLGDRLEARLREISRA